MAITIEQLQRRLNGLQVGKTKQLEDLAVQEGAIGECQYWIEVLQKEFNETHTITTLKKSKQRLTGLPLDFKDPPKTKGKVEE